MKSASRQLPSFTRTRLALAIAYLCVSQDVMATPTGEQVIAGLAEFARQNGNLTVEQLSDRAIINWENFSIAEGNITRFVQPSSTSAVLNRVISNNPSEIYGQLQANGQVFLVNANGILVGQSGVINTQSFVASTLDLSNDNFMAGGDLSFAGDSLGRIINQGQIKGVDGDVFLIAAQIDNQGGIQAEGSAGLAAGTQVMLRESGSQRLWVGADSRALATGETGADNSGLIQAAQVELTAAGGNIYALSINNSGVVRANTVTREGGKITLRAGSGSRVLNSGTLDASSPTGKGGQIEMRGEHLGLMGDARVDASGASGGGEIHLGGDYRGGQSVNAADDTPALPNAQRTYVSENSEIRADASASGNGGEVIVWADDTARFYGEISAQGGAGGGDGGFVEVSGKQHLAFDGLVNASAVQGNAGTLLLDPKNITVAVGGVVLATDVDAFADTPNDDVTIAPGTITTLTNAGTNVVLQANNDITVLDNITSSNPLGDGGDISFRAGRSILQDANITTDNGDLSFIANDPGADPLYRDLGAGVFNNNGQIFAGNGAVSVLLDGTGFSTTGDLYSGTINAGTINLTHTGATGLVELGAINYRSGGMLVTTNNLDVINDEGKLIVALVGGIASFDIGSGDLSLQGTNLDRIRFTSVNNVDIDNTIPFRLGAGAASTISGNLNAISAGAIGTDGALVVLGTTTLDAVEGAFGAAPNDITLNNSGNDFQGAVQIVSGADVTLRDSNSLDFGAFDQAVGGDFTLTSGGDITFDPNNAVTVGERFTLDSGATGSLIGLTNAANVIGLVRINNALNVELSTSGSLMFETSSLLGDLDVAASGLFTQYLSNTLTVGGNSTFTATSVDTDLTLGDDGYLRPNSFAGTVTMTTSGGGSFRNVRFRNIFAGPAVIAGLDSAPLENIALRFDGATSVTLPALNLTGTGIGTDNVGAVFYLRADNATSITQSGALVFDEPNSLARFSAGTSTDITLNHADNEFSLFRVDQANNVSLVNSTDIGLGYIYTANGTGAGNLSVTLNDDGDIYRAGDFINIKGDASFASSGITDLNLWEANNRVGGLVLDGLVDATYLGFHSLVMRDTDISGQLTLNGTSSTFSLTQAGGTSITAGNVNFSNYGGGITLDAANNLLGDIAISSMTDGDIVIIEDDPITQASAWVLGATNDIRLTTTGSQAITFDNASNNFGRITLTQADALAVTPGAVAVRNNNTEGIRQYADGGSAWTTYGNTWINSNGYSLTLDNPANRLGPLQLLGGTIVDRSVTVYANNTITDYAAWVTGPTILRGYDLGVLGAGDISLTQANTIGDLRVTGDDVTITEAGNITQTENGVWTVTGLTRLNAGANTIVLNSIGNRFAGLRIDAASTASLYDDFDGLVLDSISVSDKLTLRLAGQVTQTSALTVPNLRIFGTNGSALLTQANTIDNLAVGAAGGDFSFVNTQGFAISTIDDTQGINLGANDLSLEAQSGTITGLTNINTATTSLSLTADTLVLPQMNIAGAQTYSAGGGITLNGFITSSAAGAMTFDGPVTLGANITFTTVNSPITFEDTVDGADLWAISFSDGSGNRSFNGAVSNLGTAVDGRALILLGAGTTTFASTLDANNGITSNGRVIFRDSVTLANGNDNSTFNDQVVLGRLGGMDFSGFDGLAFNGGILMENGAATINSNNSLLGFGGNVSGPYALTLNAGTGNITPTSLGYLQPNLTGLTATAFNLSLPAGLSIAGPQTYTITDPGDAIRLNGAITSTAAGAITFNSPVLLAANSSITSLDSAINFASTLGGAFSLSLLAGTGDVNLAGAVGNAGNALTSLAVTNSGSIRLGGGQFQTTGAQTYGSNLILDADTSLTSSGSGNLRVVGTIDSASGQNYSLAINTSGQTRLDGTVGQTDALTSLTTDLGGTLLLNSGFVTTSGNQTYGEAVTLGANTQLVSTASGTVDIAGTLDGAFSLLVNTAGSTLLGGAVGTGVNLTSLATNGTGTTTLSGGAISTSGTQTYGDNLILGNNTSLTASTTTFEGSVTGAGNNLAIAGNAIFGNGVGDTLTGLGILSVSGTSQINTDTITSSGAQTYTGPVTLGANTTLTSSGSGNITLGATEGAQSLTINTAGATTFAGALGSVTALTSLATDAGGSTNLNGGVARTTGAQVYGDSLVLGANALLTSTAAGNISFNDTLDGAYTLGVNTSGVTAFNDTVGSLAPLSSLVTDAGGSVAINGASITTNGIQTFNEAVSVGANSLLDASVVTFNSTLSGGGFSVSIADDAVFNASATGLASLQVDGDSTINTTTITSTGTQTYTGAATLQENASLTGSSVNFASNLIGGGNDLAITGNASLGGQAGDSVTGIGVLSVSGTSEFNAATVTTTGAQTYTGVATINNSLTLTGDDITFGANLQSADGSQGLTLADSGDTLLSGSVGSLISPFASLQVSSESLVMNGGYLTGSLNLLTSLGGITQGGALTVGVDGNFNSAAGIALNGATTVSGNLDMEADGLIQQSAPLVVTGTTNLDTTGFAAGNVSLANSLTTVLGQTLIGGNFTLEGSDLLVQVDGTTIRIAGAADFIGADLDLDALAANIINIGATIGGSVIRGAGEITLRIVAGQMEATIGGFVIASGIDISGDVTVISQAGGLRFDAAPIAGDAILLSNAGNSFTGAVTITTQAPDTEIGAFLKTGIVQDGAISVAGLASFTAEASSVPDSGDITLTDVDNSFGSLHVSGANVQVTEANSIAVVGAEVSEILTLATPGGITQTGLINTPALLLQAGGAVTLNSANTVATLAGQVDGNLSLVNDTDLIIGTLGLFDGLASNGSVVLQTTSGDITLDQAISVNGANNITLAVADSFVNQVGLGAFSLGTGNWQVWSSDPADNTLNGLVPDFKQYNASYGQTTVSGTGDGLLYTLAPTITASLTGTVDRVYDATDVASLLAGNYQTSGAIDGDTVSITQPASGLFDDKNVGTGKAVTVENVAISSASNGAIDVFGYQLASSTLSANIGSISQATLNVSYTGVDKVYDGTVGASVTTSANILGSDAITINRSASFADANVASAIPISVSGVSLSGTDAGNYLLASTTGSASANITPAPLTISLDDVSRSYGAVNPTFTYDISGFVLSEDESVLSGFSPSTIATVNSSVGVYDITANATAANYTVNIVDGELTIDPAALTIAFDNLSRSYGAANPTLTYDISGFVLGEDESVLSGFSPTTTATVNSSVGVYDITANASADNYTVNIVDGDLTVDPAALTIAFDNLSRSYGAANPTLTYDISGFVLGEDESVLSGFSPTTTATVNSSVGVYDITANASAANYTVNIVDGDLTVDPAALTIALDNLSRSYGAANPTLTYDISGFVLGEDESVLSGFSPTTTATVNSSVGVYDITANATATNYVVNVVDGDLTVDPAALTITFDDASRTYGAANPTFVYDVSGFVLGEDESVLTGFSPMTTATANSSVGVYDITANATAANYAINIVEGDLTIDPASLVITLDNLTRGYGAINPPLTFSANGFVLGEDASVLGSFLPSTSATVNSGLGVYGVTATASATNYQISVVDGSLTVVPAALTIRMNNLQRVYGSANPELTYSLEGLVLNDSEAVLNNFTRSTDATLNSSVGSYAITASANAANYNINVVDAALTVNPANLTLRFDDLERLYGATNPELTYSIQGFVLGESETVLETLVRTTGATQMSGVNQYAITGSATAANYQVSVVDGVLQINPAPLFISVSDSTRPYATEGVSYVISVSGLVNGETTSVLNGDIAVLNSTSLSTLAGVYPDALTPYGASAANYNIVYQPGNLTITPAQTESGNDGNALVLYEQFETRIDEIIVTNHRDYAVRELYPFNRIATYTPPIGMDFIYVPNPQRQEEENRKKQGRGYLAKASSFD